MKKRELLAGSRFLTIKFSRGVSTELVLLQHSVQVLAFINGKFDRNAVIP